MKKWIVTMLLAAIVLPGCRSGDPSHRDTFILATKIAINHLNFEKELALKECEEDQIPAEECDKANDFARWSNTLSTFEAHLEDSNDIIVGAAEIYLIADAVIEEMGDDVSPRTRMYIEDIKIILYMLIREQE